MKLTPALYVRSLLAKLHPPLPKTPRESQQLLNLLETSFRKHLDDAHPNPQNPEPAVSTGLSASELGPTSNRATHSHLDSVLQHPLLVQLQTSQPAKANLTEHALIKFDTAQVHGSLKLPLVLECVRTYHRGVKRGEKVQDNQKLGNKIAAWFSSASSHERQIFLSHAPILSETVPVMYLDGCEASVWEWLRIIYERDFGSSEALGNDFAIDNLSWLRVEDNLVSVMMKASIQRGSLNDAAQQFVQASEYRAQSGRGAVEYGKATSQLAFQPLLASWKRLTASVLYRRQRHGISPDLYDSMLRFHVPFKHAETVNKGFLLIYHPSKPSALELHNKTLPSSLFADGFLSWQAGLSETFQKAFFITILDGAQLLLDQGQRAKARDLLSFAETQYSRFLAREPDSITMKHLEKTRKSLNEGPLLNIQLTPT